MASVPRQAVLVTVNRRLGLLGWLDLAQLKTGEVIADSGDFGTPGSDPGPEVCLMSRAVDILRLSIGGAE